MLCLAISALVGVTGTVSASPLGTEYFVGLDADVIYVPPAGPEFIDIEAKGGFVPFDGLPDVGPGGPPGSPFEPPTSILIEEMVLDSYVDPYGAVVETFEIWLTGCFYPAPCPPDGAHAPLFANDLLGASPLAYGDPGFAPVFLYIDGLFWDPPSMPVIFFDVIDVYGTYFGEPVWDFFTDGGLLDIFIDAPFPAPPGSPDNPFFVGMAFDAHIFEGKLADGTPLPFPYLTDLHIALEVTKVPVPAAVWLFGSGLDLLAWVRRRKIV